MAGGAEGLRRARSLDAGQKGLLKFLSAPVSGVFLEMYVCTQFGNDAEAFAYLVHKGRKALYVVKRCVN